MTKCKITLALSAILMVSCNGGSVSSSSGSNTGGSASAYSTGYAMLNMAPGWVRGSGPHLSSSGSNTGGSASAYSTGYVMQNAVPGWINGTYYIVQLGGPSTKIFKLTDAGADLIASKSKGESNGGADGGAAFFASGLVVYSAYEYSWNSPTFYGTDFGTLVLNANGVSAYIPNTLAHGYDWDGSVSIRDSTALLFRLNGNNIVTNRFDLLLNIVGPDIIIERKADNGEMENPVGTHVTSNMAAVLYDETVLVPKEHQEHNYRVTFFSVSDGAKLSRILFHSDSPGSAYAMSSAVHSNGRYLAVAISANNLSAYGDASGKGILIGIFDSNRQLVSKFIANASQTIGDQLFPRIYITQTNKVLVAFQSWPNPPADIFLYAIDGTLLDQANLEEGGHGSDVRFGSGPSGSVLASYFDGTTTKLVRLDVSGGTIAKVRLF